MAVKPVTLKDVAQKAGVSITTVSHVINKSLPDLSRRDGSLKKHHIDFLYAAARHRAEFYT